MKHPPLPPSCPMFFEIKGDLHGRDGWYFSPFEHDHFSTCWSHDSDFPYHIDTEQPQERMLMACVAHRFWIAHANRIMKKCSDEGRVHLRYGIEDEPECEAYEAAHDIAAQWDCFGFSKL